MKSQQKKLIIFLTLFLCPFLSRGQEPAVCNGKPILGNVERVLLVEANKIIDAKMDTGASMSSLSALNIKEKKRNNKTWIYFDFVIPTTHKKIAFSAPLAGFTKILMRKDEVNSAKKEYRLRPVIFMNVCIGNKNKLIEVNLIDRTQFKYPMIIGVKALKKFNAVIDAEKKFLTTPVCSRSH